MDKNYWLGRKRASAAMARDATSAEARLIHFELAGRYSIKARASDQSCLLTGDDPVTEGEQAVLAEFNPRRQSDQTYYSQLEAGALYLADKAVNAGERGEHLKMARFYRRRAGDAVASPEKI